eukprot:symbB.v1.2.018743.t1/scaffold1508.1/size114708/2
MILNFTVQRALRQHEAQLAKDKQAQEKARESLDKVAGCEARQHDEVAGLRLSERAGRLASREKRVAEDEAELLRREKRLAEKETRMGGRERDLMEAESRNMRELAARRRQAELRELRVADLESRLAEAWRYRSERRGPTLSELPSARADADVSSASGASRASIGRASIGPSTGRPSMGRMSIEPSIGHVSIEDSAVSHRMSTRSAISAAPEPASARLPAPTSGTKQEVPEITGTHLGQAEAVEFHDASGDLISFKLNGNGGVDFYINGQKEVSDVDCFARGCTLHLAGSCDKWSPARQATVPEGQEAVLQRVLALFHPACPEETPALPEKTVNPRSDFSVVLRCWHFKKREARLTTPVEIETSINSISGLVGPGEELTQTLKISAIQEEGCRSNPKVVRFVENRGAPLPPPASWERLLPLEGKEPEGPQAQAAQETVDAVDAEASRPRLTARKRVQEVKEDVHAHPQDEKWYSSALRRLTRCGGS